jgi:DUF4097 and DUF4098 domain-containing protein YvlB
MNKAQTACLNGGVIALCAVALMAIPWSLAHAARPVDERRPADPQGVVEIVNVTGSVEIEGWDRPEVEVKGSVGDNVERVELSTVGNHTSIHVMSRSARSWGLEGEAHLVVHVPARSGVWATLVSADLKVSGIQGDSKLQTVSGSVSGEVGGDVSATTVSGDIRLIARGARRIELKAISGDIHLTGGDADVDVTSVSGAAKIDMASITRGRLKSVSGDLVASLALSDNAQFEAESVSGEIRLEFPSVPAADFQVQSFSGGIDNCFGPKPMESQYGPGSRLMFKSGEGGARVRVDTKSGDVQLCYKGGRPKHAAGLPMARGPLSMARATSPRMVFPYVM